MSKVKFILVFVLFILTVLLGSVAISATLINLLGSHLLIWILPSLLTVGFVIAQIAGSKFFNLFTRAAYMVTAIWMGLFVYLLLSTVFSVILISFGIPALFGITLYIIALAIGTYGFLHARNIQIKRIEVKIDNLPEKWRGRKMVFVSDLHLGQVHAKKFAKKIVNLINEQKPDIVAIGGDLFDGSVQAISDSALPLRNIKAPLGTYFVTGNHEEFGDHVPFITAAQNTGLKVLDNEKVEIDGLQLVGVHYSRAEDRKNFTELLQTISIDRSRPSILLKHEPKDVDVARDAGISLQLSGHTHHAQVWPFRFIPKRIYKGFDYGLKKDGSLQEYTSSGVGTWGPPIRVGTDAEIVVITFV
jgi:uncharacterized protein